MKTTRDFARDAVTVQSARGAARAAASGELQSLGRASEWLNSPPLTAAGLAGKVVLVDVWTFTCINWLRTLPYVRAWADRYGDQGLVAIGVHAPEFSFEHDIDNVRRQARAMRVTYPIAIDNDFAIWRAFSNRYWPALYLIDADGQIKHHQFGEGGYAESERAIQRLLAEAGARNVGAGLTPIGASGAEVAADWDNLRSLETYVGYAQTANFASPRGVATDVRHAYSVPRDLDVNHWALAGDWTVSREKAALDAAHGRIAYRFHARDLHLVMGPTVKGASVPFRVTIDGRPPGDAHGTDVDAEGNGVVSDQRLHQLIRQPGPIADRQFEIEFLEPGVEGYCVTFG
jgi:thiol-disulfide isomerase/thioredoxin